ncbi:hypothetical protein [Helicobacter macacae]|nr:hypothetical protein [Helicobacter macacae]
MTEKRTHPQTPSAKGGGLIEWRLFKNRKNRKENSGIHHKKVPPLAGGI